MTVWRLSTHYKKSAVEKQLWYKDGVTISKEEGYRWGTFYCESDEMPDVDLANPDGYELYGYDWELYSLDDGCWSDWTFPEDMSSAEREQIEAAWDFSDGLENLGWSNDDTEYWFHGPLIMTNETTGEVFSDMAQESQEKTDQQLAAELDELIAEMPGVPEDAAEEPTLTDWYDDDTPPARTGSYEVITMTWPFVLFADWNGREWRREGFAIKPTAWRGLAEDPAK
ncbi:hypothetical protein [Haliscomenobacter sp.]|uniref:hypothetical protein n=1 Tax=Haliscomenobacter sp. TaxID=2717303 RepID=UPI0033651943